MARMTVAEVDDWNALRAVYNQRLFALFALAQEFNAELKFTKETVTFVVGFREEFVLPSALSERRDNDVLDVLVDLDYEFERLREARDEEKRRYALKQSALAKLTEEERAALGL